MSSLIAVAIDEKHGLHKTNRSCGHTRNGLSGDHRSDWVSHKVYAETQPPDQTILSEQLYIKNQSRLKFYCTIFPRALAVNLDSGFVSGLKMLLDI